MNTMQTVEEITKYKRRANILLVLLILALGWGWLMRDGARSANTRCIELSEELLDLKIAILQYTE